jgi:uncharacterized SAM-binding protein YcdF (DUF218 family)
VAGDDAETMGKDRPKFLSSRPFRHALEGGAIGVGLWCVWFALQILPSTLADTPGVLLLTGLGLAIGATRFRGALVGLLQLAAVVTLVVTLSPLSEAIAAHWVRQNPIPSSAVSAVVALSGGINPDTTISGEAADHLLAALELLRAGNARSLVTTTTADVFPTGFVSSETDQARIIGLSAQPVEWLRTPRGYSTHDEAVASAKLLLPRGVRQIAVITSPMHTRRACAVFEAVGFQVTCVAARLRNSGGQPVTSDPTHRLAVFGQFVYEVAASAEYSIRGWLPRKKPLART